MKIEKFENITIGYMRRTGKYGPENKLLMETFKKFLTEHGLFDESTIILGIALDDPNSVPSAQLRYDIGVIINDIKDIKDIPLDTRIIPSGNYAVFEIPHTREAVSDFWKNIDSVLNTLDADCEKPVIERYSSEKISKGLCEFCIPLK